LWNAYSLELVVATLEQRSVRAQKIDKESTTEDDIDEELMAEIQLGSIAVVRGSAFIGKV